MHSTVVEKNIDNTELLIFIYCQIYNNRTISLFISVINDEDITELFIEHDA